MNYLIGAFVLGILYGLGPCTIICAPILIPLIILTSKDGKSGVIQTLTFCSGKILSYIFLGLISGHVGYLFSYFFSKEMVGVFLIAIAVFIPFREHKKCFLKISGKHISFLSGAMIGLFPCPPLLALLSLAILAKSALIGAFMGLIFGIGTLLTPLLLLGFLAGKFSSFNEKFRRVNIIASSLFLISLGVIYLI